MISPHVDSTLQSLQTSLLTFFTTQKNQHEIWLSWLISCKIFPHSNRFNGLWQYLRTEKGNQVSADFSVQELMIVFDLWCYQVDNVLWEVYVYSIPIITKYFCCRKDLSLNLLKKNTQLKCTPRHHCSHDLVHLLNQAE